MIDTIFIGLSLGSVLLLVALGLAITYGAMGVINMAHGEMVMIGAYTAVLTSLYLGFGLIAAMPVAFLVTALLGLAIEKLVVRRLYGRLLDTLLATWGVAILVQQAVRLSFGLAFFGITIAGLGPGLQNVSLPEWLGGTYGIAGSQISVYRSFIILVSVALAALTWGLMYRTSFGMQLRAIMRNPQMAAACGIDTARINALAFAYGSGLAGVAGVLIGLYSNALFPLMGQPMLHKGIAVIILGGM
ncbi:MAG: urea ABC transporter permease subunit UrtB, partial [Starkeya sp.]|nr:urea ABC transporter permease subunit UrtB [Starkeya sp.]